VQGFCPRDSHSGRKWCAVPAQGLGRSAHRIMKAAGNEK
jgi:hypothetical protein